MSTSDAACTPEPGICSSRSYKAVRESGRYPSRSGPWKTIGQPYRLDAVGVNVDQSLSASADGTLAYLAVRQDRVRLVWLNRKGEELEVVETPHRQMGSPRLSPEGRRVAISVSDTLSTSVWIYDLERGTRTRLTQGPDDVAVFWRGPEHVVFGRRREGQARRELVEVRADGSGGERVLVPDGGVRA